MRTLIGTAVAVVAALFSSCAGPVAACVDADPEVREVARDVRGIAAETRKARAEAAALDAQLMTQHRLQRARAAWDDARLRRAREAALRGR